jgi:GNAT superfamily N-acetyltransferase
MSILCLHDKAQIEAFTRHHPLLHLYELGDLDDFFWPHTTWYALTDGETVQQLALLYSDLAMPVLLAHSEPESDSMPWFMEALLPLLPRRFYSHLSSDALPTLATAYHLEPHGRYDKMGLRHPAALTTIDTSAVSPLSIGDLHAINALYQASYPDTWFVPRMLETGRYYGIWDEAGRLTTIAGVHVYSPQYKVAALGNVTTHPEVRGRGLATLTCAKLCQELLSAGIETIGLNVRADNTAAIRAYQKLGFERVAEYGEYTLELRR